MYKELKVRKHDNIAYNFRSHNQSILKVLQVSIAIQYKGIYNVTTFTTKF